MDKDTDQDLARVGSPSDSDALVPQPSTELASATVTPDQVINEPDSWLMAVKEGDEVAYQSRFGRTIVRPVLRVTRTQIKVEARTFSRRNGYEVGGGRSWMDRATLMPLTPVLRDKIAAREAADVLQRVVWGQLPDAFVLQIHSEVRAAIEAMKVKAHDA